MSSDTLKGGLFAYYKFAVPIDHMHECQDVRGQMTKLAAYKVLDCTLFTHNEAFALAHRFRSISYHYKN